MEFIASLFPPLLVTFSRNEHINWFIFSTSAFQVMYILILRRDN